MTVEVYSYVDILGKQKPKCKKAISVLETMSLTIHPFIPHLNSFTKYMAKIIPPQEYFGQS